MKTDKKQLRVGRVVWETIRGNALLSLAIVLAVAGAVGAALVPPLVLGRLVDDLTGGAGLTLRLPLLYLLFTALSGVLESAREGALTLFGQKTTRALRRRLMEKQGRLSAETLSRQEPGALVSRFVGDVDTVENLFTGGIISMAADACQIVSILVVVRQCSRGLAWLLLALLPLIFLFTRFVQRRMLKNQLANRLAVSRASGYVPETVHNIRTIRTLGREEYMEKRYDSAVAAGYRAMEGTNFYDALYSPVILAVSACTVGAVMLLSASGNAGVLSLFGMSAGTAVAVIGYIGQVFTPVESLGMEIQTIQSAVAGVRRINDFFALEEPAPVPPQAEDPAAPAAEMKNVSFSYEAGQAVLQNLSLTIKKGERATLTGRTGAGKSTVFRLLLGLYAPQGGTVRICGRDPRALQGRERRRLYGYVEQRFHPVPGTVRDQITLYDASLTDEDVCRAAALAGLEDAIAALPQGCNTPLTPDIFSQGQRQLLSIARAVAADPQLLLLDEITANLDAETERAVLRALQKASENRTVLSISHRTGADFGRLIPIGEEAEIPLETAVSGERKASV